MNCQHPDTYFEPTNDASSPTRREVEICLICQSWRINSGAWMPKVVNGDPVYPEPAAPELPTEGRYIVVVVGCVECNAGESGAQVITRTDSRDDAIAGATKEHYSSDEDYFVVDLEAGTLISPNVTTPAAPAA